MQTRKSHRKSRLGCKTCKQRKVKCDEKQPICARCEASGRTCSYLNVPSYPVPNRSISHRDLRKENSSEPPRHSPPFGDLRPPLELSDVFATTERYSLLHFDLFQHFKERLFGEATKACRDVHRIFEVAIREAFRTSYLMDQILALAASHKSTLSEQDREWYRSEAIRLQTRALTQFSGKHESPSSMAPFIFSTLLGQHVLFDAFSWASGLPSVLDNLAQCLELHQGIRVVAGQTMSGTGSTFDEHLADSPIHIETETILGSECQSLMERLKASDLSESTISVYTEAATILQYLFDSVNKAQNRRLVVVQEWLVRVSTEYIALMKQRRPEALIILAYYGVLLHHARDYWAFSGSGSYLIRGISNHLGDYWLEWLDWPNAQISNEPSRTFWSVMNTP